MAHSNIHTTGAAITFFGAKALGCDFFTSSLLATGSHYLLDFILESRFNPKEELFIEVIFHVLFLALGHQNNLLPEFTWVVFCGNFFDIYDKKFGLSLIDSEKYPVTYTFHSRSGKGMKLSIEQTISLSFLNLILLSLFYIVTLKSSLNL